MATARVEAAFPQIPMPAIRIVWLLLVALAFAAPNVEAATVRQGHKAARLKPPGAICDRYASRNAGDRGNHHGRPGSKRNPFSSPQALVSALSPGQTGCLRGGVYDMAGSELSFFRSGDAGSPITLRSYPGERATIVGGPVYIPARSDYIRIQKVNIDTSSTGQVGVQIMSTDDALIGDRITNHADRATCIILGSNAGWGEAVGTVLRNDVIHDCGSPLDGNQDHAIYFDNSVNARITHNTIWGTAGFAIHLYENARGNVIRQNVIDHNRYGVIFAGNAGYRTSGNIVSANVIADTTEGYAVSSWWNGPVGVGNVLSDNCIYQAAKGAISRPTTGFKAIGNVIARPLFVDAREHRFGLLPGSGCLHVVGFAAARSLGHAARHHK